MLVLFTGHLEVAELLIANGGDIELSNAHGRTVLHVSASRGHSSLVQYFLQQGALVNAVDSNNRYMFNIPLGMVATIIVNSCQKICF